MVRLAIELTQLNLEVLANLSEQVFQRLKMLRRKHTPSALGNKHAARKCSVFLCELLCLLSWTKYT